ncbi:MAG: thermonuclease family protein [Planctomycetes bacterium]|nr:thermonuclease family protein [Planctomycetota bacterium]MCB9830111.1 thermonuclease family protein [Planctomycetota bacterium]MCB9899944.1 thermonuclease family protein [Planctomycetota bacterium]
MPHRVLSLAAVPLLLLGLLTLTRIAPPACAGDRPGAETIPLEHIRVDDGDSVQIVGADGVEEVRLLGIDCPEIQHLQHDLPFDQPFGREATAFLQGCLAMATKAELRRSGQTDPFGRTLAYLVLDGRNVSVLLLAAGRAMETVTRYGDNGMPEEAAACLAAAAKAPPLPFEDPREFRRRQKALAARMKADGTYPVVPAGR